MAQEKEKGPERFTLPPWLPVVASIVLMVMVALMAAANLRSLGKATQWRRHSTQVILAGQAFENNLLDIQRGLRGYVTLGDTNALAAFYASAALEPEELNNLGTLTKDNEDQQQRLKKLGAAVGTLLSFDARTIAIYRQEGFPGVSRQDATGQSRVVFGNARDVLTQFMGAEQKLWDTRDASEQTDYRAAGRLLVTCSALAAVLLVVAIYLASRELSFRRRAEAKLRETLVLQNAVLGASDYGIVATDRGGIVKVFNAAAERMLGYTASEVVGKMTPVVWRDPNELVQQAEKLSKELGVPVKPTFEAIAKKVEAGSVDEGECTYICKDGRRFPCMIVVTALGSGASGYLGVFRDISDRKKHEEERERLITELKNTLAEIKTLHGLIPICAWCKSVRSDTGYWQTVEQYVRSHSDASFSHGVCPTCAQKFKDDVFRKGQNAEQTPVAKA